MSAGDDHDLDRVQGLDHDVPEVDDAVRVVALDGEGAAGKLAAGHALRRSPIVRLGPVDRRLAVNLDYDALADHLDVIVEPLPILRRCVVDYVLYRVETAGLLAVAVRRVDLALVALGGPVGLLVGGVEVDARVGFGHGHHLGLELGIGEGAPIDRPDVEQMAALAMDNELAVFDAEGALVLAGPPAFEAFGAVEQGDPAVVGHIGQRLDLDVPVMNDAVGIVALDGEGAAVDLASAATPAFRLDPVDRRSAVDLDRDVFAHHLDVVMEPLAVFRRGVIDHVLHAVEAAGLLAVAVRRVDLAFIALVGPAGLLVCRVEVNTRVRFGHCHHVGAELEVPEAAPVDRSGVE